MSQYDEAFCRSCGRRVGDRTYPGEPLCTPLSCSVWEVTHTYDYSNRTWVAT